MWIAYCLSVGMKGIMLIMFMFLPLFISDGARLSDRCFVQCRSVKFQKRIKLRQEAFSEF